MSHMSVAAGWYPQPDGSHRWWDGTAWTEHVTPAPAPTPTPTGQVRTVARKPAKVKMTLGQKIMVAGAVLFLVASLAKVL